MDISLEITALITPVAQLFKASNTALKNLLDNGVEEYLEAQTEKLYFTNTFLHRSEKVVFYEVYYPIHAYYTTRQAELNTDFSNIDILFQSYKCITLIGSAGSGKSTLMRYIFLESLKNKSRIPVLIELRTLNDYPGNLESMIVEKILKSRIKPSDDSLKKALDSGCFLFQFDGYDEVVSGKKEEIKRQIDLFVDTYHKNRYLMTTRPGSGIESFSRFYNFFILPLKANDIIGFIDKMVVNSERRDRIKTAINDPANKSYEQYLSNPLLLSMFILAFESHPEIPTRKSAFYRNVFDTLYSRHDGITKNSFPRERLTKLQREQFETVLARFSFITFSKGVYAFTYEVLTDTLRIVKKSTGYDFNIDDLISDLHTSISILSLDGLEYKFPHRSMQEYFAAQFISNLPAEKKSQAYNSIGVTGKLSTYTIWDLCYELDSFYFISCFVLPLLKQYAEELNGKEGLELLATFADKCELGVIVYGSSKGRTVGMEGVNNLFMELTSYYGIISLGDILGFLFPIETQEELLRVINESTENNEFIALSEPESQPYLAVLAKYGFDNLITDYVSSLNFVIADLEAEINRENDSIDDLLNL